MHKVHVLRASHVVIKVLEGYVRVSRLLRPKRDTVAQVPNMHPKIVLHLAVDGAGLAPCDVISTPVVVWRKVAIMQSVNNRVLMQALIELTQHVRQIELFRSRMAIHKPERLVGTALSVALLETRQGHMRKLVHLVEVHRSPPEDPIAYMGLPENVAIAAYHFTESNKRAVRGSLSEDDRLVDLVSGCNVKGRRAPRKTCNVLFLRRCHNIKPGRRCDVQCACPFCLAAFLGTCADLPRPRVLKL
mmetsp:Transcript_8494/g.18050  ORF Transcript_8494/g.18050 Transcript_8494/m.18050 type:complete len:245 (+) Transcript_8494:410-1144(+)